MPEPLRALGTEPSSLGPLTPPYRWNEAARRYIGPGGRFVPQSAIRGALETVIDASKGGIRELSEALQAGRVTLAEWQLGMARQIKLIHTASGALAQGGWAQMSQADWGSTGQLLRQQYAWLNNFAAEVGDGSQPLNGNFLRRANMYGDAGRGTYERQRQRLHRDQGYVEEMRVLAPVDNCEDCVDWAGHWAPLGSLPPLFASVCRTNCHCIFWFRTADGVVSEG